MGLGMGLAGLNSKIQYAATDKLGVIGGGIVSDAVLGAGIGAVVGGIGGGISDESTVLKGAGKGALIGGGIGAGVGGAFGIKNAKKGITKEMQLEDIKNAQNLIKHRKNGNEEAERQALDELMKRSPLK
jgi:hypothetical protein